MQQFYAHNNCNVHIIIQEKLDHFEIDADHVCVITLI